MDTTVNASSVNANTANPAATLTVSAVMARSLVSVSSETTVPDAVKLLRDHHIRRLPVLDGHRLVGIVSDRDLKEAMPSQATSLSIWEMTSLLARLTVREVMTTSVISTHPDALLTDAAYTMLQHKIGGLPVVNAEHELVGMVTVTDVLREYVGRPAERVR